jgi:hypothetical protein
VTRRKLGLIGVVSFAMIAASAGDKAFSPPPAAAANTYPAHETHQDESVSIAVDPYDTPEKTAIFKIKYRQIGFLPVRLIISNDGSTPLMLNDMRVEFITARRDKIEPAVTEDVLRRITHPQKADTKRPIPFPIPRGKPEPVKKDQVEELQSAAFVPFPVTPHSNYSGFLFFDIQGIDDPEAGAHVYISGMRAGTKELFYFDIPLEKYLESSPK